MDGWRFGFDLQTVELGVDPDGDTVDTCIVRYASGAPEPTRADFEAANKILTFLAAQSKPLSAGTNGSENAVHAANVGLGIEKPLAITAINLLENRGKLKKDFTAGSATNGYWLVLDATSLEIPSDMPENAPDVIPWPPATPLPKQRRRRRNRLGGNTKPKCPTFRLEEDSPAQV